MRKTPSIAAVAAITCGALVLSACGSTTSQSDQPNRDAGAASGALSSFPGWSGDAANVVEWDYSAGKHPGFECYHDVTKDGETTTTKTFNAPIAGSTALPLSTADLNMAVNGTIGSTPTWKYWPAADSDYERDRHALRLVANTDGVRTWRGTQVMASAAAEKQLFGPANSTSNPAFRCATAGSDQFFVVPDPSAKTESDANSKWAITSGVLPWNAAEAQWIPGATFQLRSQVNPDLCALNIGTVGHSNCTRPATTFKVITGNSGAKLQDAADPSSCLDVRNNASQTAIMTDCEFARSLQYDPSTGFINTTEADGNKLYLSFGRVDNLEPFTELTWDLNPFDESRFTLRPLDDGASTNPLHGLKVRVAGSAYSKRVTDGSNDDGNNATLSASCTPVSSENSPLACASTTIASGDSREVGLVGSYLWTLPLRINIANETPQTLIMSSQKPSTSKAMKKAKKKNTAPLANPVGPAGTETESLLPADGSGTVSIPGKSGNTVQSGSIGFLRTFKVNPTPLSLNWVTLQPDKKEGSVSDAVTPKPFRTVLRLKAMSLNALAQAYQDASPKQSADEWRATATADCAAGEPSVAGVSRESFLKDCGDLPLLVETDGQNLNDVRVASFDIKADWASQYVGLQPTGPAASSNLCANSLKVESPGTQSISTGPDGFIDLTLTIARQSSHDAIKGGLCNFNRNLN